MNTSTSQRRWLIWLPLLGIAAWLAFFGDKTPESIRVTSSQGSTTTPPTRVEATNRRPETATTQSVHLDALLPREKLFPANSRQTVAHDLFAANSWTPPPKPVAAAPILPPPPPTAPPIPYTFIGKKLEANTWEVYVARGEQSFVLREGGTVDNNYRVHRISPPSLTLVYLPLGQTQTLSIGESQ